MSAQGVKRASPGDEDEKNPFGNVELTDEDAKKLQIVQKDIARTDLYLGMSFSLSSCYDFSREVGGGRVLTWPRIFAFAISQRVA